LPSARWIALGRQRAEAGFGLTLSNGLRDPVVEERRGSGSVALKNTQLASRDAGVRLAQCR